jgi:hypothetical protein
MKRVLAVIHDPGGASGLIPVLQSLAGEVALTIYAGKFVSARVTSAGLPFRELASDLSSEAAQALLQEVHPEVLITGTSWGSPAEQNLRNEAHLRGLPSVVFLDYWSNYAKRWEGATYPLAEMKDRIAVLDDGMHAEMLAEGFPAQSLVVTGHPRLEALSREISTSKKSKVGKVLFLSEPARSSYNGPIAGHPLLKLAEAFAALGREITLLVKLHPKEELGTELTDLLTRVNATGILASIVTDVMLPMGFLDFEYVFGYQSMGLFEAAAMGAKAFAFPSAPPGPGLAAGLHRFGIAQLSADPQVIGEAVLKADAERGVLRVGTLVQGATVAICQMVLKPAL